MIDIFLYLILGLGVGFLSGLFGVGGGIIIVPTLFWIFNSLHFPFEHLMHIAVGTSLACMVITAAGSTWAHQQNGHIQWGVWRQCLLGGVLGAPTGVFLAQHLSTLGLKRFFALFLIVITIDMLKHRPIKNLIAQHQMKYRGLGFGVGFLSGCLGVGGGVFMVPILLRMGYSFVQASSTAVATILVTATIGAISAIVAGLGQAGLPADTIGFVYWPAMMGIGFAGLFSSKWGTRLANRLPYKTLKRCFAVLSFTIAAEMLFF